jgi:hypothetical protein
MNPAEHQAVVDVAKVVVNEYFDHYLTEVWPKQIGIMLSSHNNDALAHDPRFVIHTLTCPMKRKMDHLKWMVAGGAAVAGVAGTLITEHIGAIIRALI